MSTQQQKDRVRELLDGIDAAEIRELSIEAMRIWWRSGYRNGQLIYALHGDHGRALVPLLFARKRQPLPGPEELNGLKEPFIDAQHEPWMAHYLEFVWWFVSGGFAIPLSGQNSNFISFRLTARGAAFLDAAEPELHPYLPGFVDRIRTRCPGLPAEVLSLLNDSQRCIDRMLLRPAIVMMGVAYELAIEAVATALVGRNALPANAIDPNTSPARRISDIRGVIDNVMPGTTPRERDDRFTVHRAYQFADDLRRRRNDASHTRPAYGFEDRAEVEEFYVSAGRMLPSIWRLV